MPKLSRYIPVLGASAALAIGGAGATALATDGDQPDNGNRCCEGQQRYSAWDKHWLQAAIKTDMFEIASGKMAQRHAASQGIRSFGAQLVADHIKSVADL